MGEMIIRDVVVPVVYALLIVAGWLFGRWLARQSGPEDEGE